MYCKRKLDLHIQRTLSSPGAVLLLSPQEKRSFLKYVVLTDYERTRSKISTSKAIISLSFSRGKIFSWCLIRLLWLKSLGTG
jgi:hypothetical protein